MTGHHISVISIHPVTEAPYSRTCELAMAHLKGSACFLQSFQST